MDKTTEIKNILTEIYNFSKDQFGSDLDSIILYGSYARNENDAESDIDIMIIVDMNQYSLADYRSIFSQFGTKLDLKYDVFTSIVLQDLETFEKWKSTIPYYQNVLKEGVRISA